VWLRAVARTTTHTSRAHVKERHVELILCSVEKVRRGREARESSADDGDARRTLRRHDLRSKSDIKT